MNIWKTSVLTLALLGLTSFASLADSSIDTRVILEPHGEKLCSSGCALSRHPTPYLSESRYLELLDLYAEQALSEESPALEELLYFGVQSRGFLERGLGEELLDPERLELLQRELKRENLVMEFRIIDRQGKVRVSLAPTSVELDKRYIFEPLETLDFQPPEASGTLKRVGLHHIWQRI